MHCSEGLQRAQSGTSLQCSVDHAPAGGADGSYADNPDLEIKLTNGRLGGTATAEYVVVVFNKTDDNSLTGTNHNCHKWYKLSRIQ